SAAAVAEATPGRPAAQPSVRRLGEVLAPRGSATSPWLKPRTYRACELGNGLRALLVEDLSAERFEVAFTAAVGQFDDPEGSSGLAHLTEHLLLSGPGPNETSPLGPWIEEREGDVNGYTGFDSSSYFVTLPAAEWSEGLARFGYALSPGVGDVVAAERFFPEAVEREVERVDEEIRGGAQSAGVRYLQLLRRQAAPGHPMREFGPGSVKTLLPAAKDGAFAWDVIEGRMRTLGARAAKLFREGFTSGGATLAVVGPVPLNAIEVAAAAAFGNFPSSGGSAERELRRSSGLADPLPALPGGRPPPVFLLEGQPTLSLTWSVPFQGEGSLDAAAFRAAKPDVLLSHVVAYQGDGSLTDWLESKGWVPDFAGPKVSARTPLATEAGFALWEVKIKLSRAGAARWREVAAAVFAVLAALRRRWTSGPDRRDFLRDAAEEVSLLAQVSWRYPDRPPTALELANDMRTAPAPEAFVAARRLFLRPGAWEAALAPSGELAGAVADEAARLLGLLGAERARCVVSGAPPEGAAVPSEDPFLGVRYAELAPEEALWGDWARSSRTPAPWWLPPPPNPYLTRGEPPPQAPELPPELAAALETPFSEADPGGAMPAVMWLPPCRPRLISREAPGGSAPAPAVLWYVQGCLYSSGQFAEVVQPLGDLPLLTLTLWLPAARVDMAGSNSRAAGRMWLLSLQRALEGPLYGAALAGCRWEVAFFDTGTSSSEPQGPGGCPSAGVRLAFQGFSGVLPRFAADVARRIASHTGPSGDAELEVVRRLALEELRRGVPAKLGNAAAVTAVQRASLRSIRDEAAALWHSAGAAAPLHSQALVAGRVGSEAAAASLAGAALAALQLPGSGAPAEGEATQPGRGPARVLMRRPTWEGPVGRSLCLASGVPSMLGVCGRTS
ncbi:unnamed protein product, partial [Prorocentrum cordatum]